MTFEGVSHRFGDFEALRDLSLTINRGDIYGLLGLNGAGKTTSIRVLLGLLRHQTGKVKIFGQEVPSARLEVCNRIGATIEGAAFYPHLTGRANLELLHRLGDSGPGSRTPAQALQWVGLDHAADIKVRKYSMGMMQRLYIAQAIIGRAELLVLDEPTSNLDPKGIMEVRRLIQRLNKDEGLTVLLCSHQLAEVEDICNRVAIINRGRRIVESTVADLFHTEHCFVEIHVDRLDDAENFVSSLGWCTDVGRTESGFRARITRDRRGELCGALVREGFIVSEFAERRPTLEDYFHERIAQDAA